MKEFADDHFKFGENGRNLSKRVDNTVGKEKLLVTSNFFFSHSVFKWLVSQGRQKVSLCWNALNPVRGLLERSSDLSNSGEFKRQTAYDNTVYIHSFLRYYSDTQSVSSWFYKETEIKI